ncbi:hypothetical protein ACKKBF_B36030 [Auxenochlorella protothecoides x Auxenochlorella symbiontica]
MAEGLLAAVRSGSLPILERVLDSQRCRDEIDRITTGGGTALHHAVWRGEVEAVQALLSAGADVEVADLESGWTPLHHALYRADLACAACLLGAGARLGARDARGRTPPDLLPGPAARCGGAPPAGATLYAWGDGANFALGTGCVGVQPDPGAVDGLGGGQVARVGAGKFHSVALGCDGAVWTWGWGRGGRLGHPEAHIHGGSSAVLAPRRVALPATLRVLGLAAGKHHTLLRGEGGEVWALGSNRHGQLGIPGVDTAPTPRRVPALRGARVLDLAAANKHSAAAAAGGEVFTWGANGLGQLGYGRAGAGEAGAAAPPRAVEALRGRAVVAVAAAKRHTLALTADGEVLAWGHCGVSPRRVPLAGARDVAAPDGAPLHFHRGHGEAARPVATAIAAGAAHSCALTASGVVLCWRSADPLLQAREVGGALAGRHVVHVAAGKYRTAAVTRDGSVFCWEGRADYFPAGARNAREGKRRAAGVAVGEGAQRGRPVQVGPHARVLGSSPLGTSPTGRSLGSAHAPQAGSYMERFAAGRQHGRAPNGASLHEGAGGSAPRRGDSSPLLGTSPGSSPGPARLLGTPGNAGAGAAGAEGDAPPEILPERVNRLPGATAVAVGEKHTLALHEWYTLELPDADGDGGSGGGCTERKGADACRGAPAALGAAGETAGGEADPPVGAESGDALGAARATCPGAPGAPTPSSRDVASSPAQGGEGEESSTARGPPPLQHLCERLVGAAYVTPASALRVLGTADSMGARLLRAHALSVALGSLHACLAADAAGLARLPPHVLAEMGTALRAAESRRRGGASAAGGDGAPGAHYPWPTAHGGAAASPATLEFAGGRGVPGLASPLPTRVPLGAGSPPSFRAAGEALEEAARARLARTLAKKLQQVGVLAARRSAGERLDAQQAAKLAAAPCYEAAAAALAAGVPSDQALAILHAGDEKEGGDGRAEAARKGAKEVAGALASRGVAAEPAGVAKAGGRETGVVQLGFAPSGRGDAGSRPWPERPGTSGASPQAPVRHKATERRGGLSLFLKGELDAPTRSKPGPQPPPTSTSPGPAWGGARPAVPSCTGVAGVATQAASLSLADSPGPTAQRPTASKRPATPQQPPSSVPARGEEGGAAQRLPLAAFLKGGEGASRSLRAGASWKTAGGTSGPSPAPAPSMQQVLEEQWSRVEQRRRAGPGLATPGAAGGGRQLLGSSPHSAPPGKWYVPEEAVAPVRSMAAIQKEEHAMKELARLYGAGNVRMAPSRGPGAE